MRNNDIKLFFITGAIPHSICCRGSPIITLLMSKYNRNQFLPQKPVHIYEKMRKKAKIYIDKHHIVWYPSRASSREEALCPCERESCRSLKSTDTKSDEPGDCRHQADLPGNFRGACPAPLQAVWNRAAEELCTAGDIPALLTG